MLRWLSLGFMLAAAVPAQADLAEVICDRREALILRLERSYGAQPNGRGLRGPDAILEIWSVPGSGDWTIVQSYPSGLACIMAMGQSWEPIAQDDPA